MSTLWGERRPGSDFSVGEDEMGGGFVAMGEPDRVRTPPELGSQEYRVDSISVGKCPCGQDHEVKTYALVGTNLRVSDCSLRGYLWWKPRA